MMLKPKLLLFACLVLLSTACRNDSSELPTPKPTPTNDRFEQSVLFDFSSPNQLNDLPTFGEDYSIIENEALKSTIQAGTHKGLGRKFYFQQHSTEPDEAEIEFDLFLDENYQKGGVLNEVGKLPGFEGIYDNTAGWGGQPVTDQKSWSVRIGHTGANTNGDLPIGLYIYHPNMTGTYGTVVNPNFTIKTGKQHHIQLYQKLNTIGQANGTLRFIINGKTVYESSEWLFRTDPSVHIRSVWLDSYIGGKTPSKYNTYTIIDNLEIKW